MNITPTPEQAQETVERLSHDLPNIDRKYVTDLVVQFGLYGGARILGFNVEHYDNLSMAGRLAIENLRHTSPKTLLEYAEVMRERLNKPTYNFIIQNHVALQKALDDNNHYDFDNDWFSANTFITTYSAAPSYGASPVETPQYIWMRVAVQEHHDSENAVDTVIQRYEDMARGMYTPASPTIFNAGMNNHQMSSCFLLTIGDDMEQILKHGIYRGGMISKASGGLGFDVSRVRHSEIGNRGVSHGIVPMLQLYNYMVRYVDQCFTPETTVYTRTGPKAISEITPGDLCVTIDGSHDTVDYVMPHEFDGEVIDIEVTNAFKPVSVTQVHPMFAIRAENDSDLTRENADWIPAGRLQVGDFIALSIPTYENDLKEYDSDDLMFYGLMISNGSIDRACKCSIIVSGNPVVKFVHDYLALRCIKYKTKTLDCGAEYVTWSGTNNFRFTRNMLCDHTGNSIIHSNFLHLPREKTVKLLQGLFYPFPSGYETTCIALAESVRYLLLRTNIEIIGSSTIDGKGDCYQFEISGDIRSLEGVEMPKEGIVWARVKNVSAPRPYKGIVYDLQMQEKHNYLTHIGLAHNGGFRRGAATVYLRPHHIDIEEFIELPRKVGDKNARAHDLNICIWYGWLFMERVRTDGLWTLFCPARTSHLNNLSGVAFTKAYIEAENDPTIAPHHKRVIRAQELYDKIVNVQKEAGMPYLMNGDAANLKSNHRHKGYIRSSNLCLEVIEYTDDETIAVCNLHSLSLRMYAKHHVNRSLPAEVSLREAVDFELLSRMSRRVIENLNKVIDHNWYPLDKHDEDGNVTKPKIINKSNKAQRPTGMGVSGFAEMLHILDLPFEDGLTKVLNKMVFACMYWNALAQSVQLSILDGPCAYHEGSPASEGKLQFDLWREEFAILGPNNARKYEDDDPLDPSVWGQLPFELVYNGVVIDTILPTWDDIKRCVMSYGLRNSLLIALMPTASTAQIRRNCETVEAHQNNMYSRKVLKASYPVLNRYLVGDLGELGAWNGSTVDYLRVKNGSIQGLGSYVENNPILFPNYTHDEDRMALIEKKYKTIWELPQRLFVDLDADRLRYICQSASHNVYMLNPEDTKIKARHLYAEMKGLKTIMYYLRQTGGETIKFTADPTTEKHIRGLTFDDPKTTNIKVVEKVDNEETTKAKFICTDTVCLSCS